MRIPDSDVFLFSLKQSSHAQDEAKCIDSIQGADEWAILPDAAIQKKTYETPENESAKDCGIDDECSAAWDPTYQGQRATNRSRQKKSSILGSNLIVPVRTRQGKAQALAK